MWLGWLEQRPIHRKAAGSISGQGTYLGCVFNPHKGMYREMAANRCSSLSQSNEKMSLGEDKNFFSN